MLIDQRDAAQAALDRVRSHVQDVETNRPIRDAEEQLLRLMAALKRAVADGIEREPTLTALRNMIGQMFEFVVLVRDPGFGTGRIARRGVVPDAPGPDP